MSSIFPDLYSAFSDGSYGDKPRSRTRSRKSRKNKSRSPGQRQTSAPSRVSVEPPYWLKMRNVASQFNPWAQGGNESDPNLTFPGAFNRDKKPLPEFEMAQRCLIDRGYSKVGKKLKCAGNGCVYITCTKKGASCDFVFKIGPIHEEEGKGIKEIEGRLGQRMGELGIGPKVYDFFECKSIQGKRMRLIVMEKIQGGDFEDYFLDDPYKTDEDGNPTPHFHKTEMTMEVAQMFTDRLEEFWTVGGYHGDFHAENAMVITDDNDKIIDVKLIDWGFADTIPDWMLQQRQTRSGKTPQITWQELNSTDARRYADMIWTLSHWDYGKGTSKEKVQFGIIMILLTEGFLEPNAWHHLDDTLKQYQNGLERTYRKLDHRFKKAVPPPQYWWWRKAENAQFALPENIRYRVRAVKAL